MNYRILVIIAFLALFGCETHKEISVPQKFIFLKYKDSNTIGLSNMKSFRKDFKKAFQQGNILDETRNDTTFLKLYDNTGKLLSKRPWLYESQYKVSELSCNKKLRIDVGRLTFYFCYADMEKHVEKLSKSGDEFIAKKYTYIKENLGTLEDHYDEKKHGFATSFFLSRLLRDATTEIKDNGGENITEMRIGDINTGWGQFDEIYFFNHKKDTVAALYNAYLVE
jgi:hypothetical protein